MSFASKHKRYVNECYQNLNSPGQVAIINGKLSALCYYINASPSKLQKVSSYLKVKIPRDLQRQSPSYNIVTIEIVIGIIRGCPNNFPSFAPCVVQIMKYFCEFYLLNIEKPDSKDIMCCLFNCSPSQSPQNIIQSKYEIILKIHDLFYEFSKNSKPLLPSIRDDVFFRNLTLVLASLINPQTSSCTQEDLLKIIIASISMEDFTTPKGDQRISHIVNVLVYENLQICKSSPFPIHEIGNKNQEMIDRIINRFTKRNHKESILTRRSTSGAISIAAGTSTDSHSKDKITVDDMEMRFYALWVSLIDICNSTTLPFLIGSLFDSMDHYNGWIHPRLYGSFFDLLMYCIPSQHLCLIMSLFFKKLERINKSNKSGDAIVALIDTISILLKSNRSPLGYSAIEMAGNFLKILRKHRIHPKDNQVASSEISLVMAPQQAIASIRNIFLSLMVNATFTLQKWDIIHYIITKAFLSSLSTVGGGGTVNNESSIQKFIITSQSNVHTQLSSSKTDCPLEEAHFKAVVWGILFILCEAKVGSKMVLDHNLHLGSEYNNVKASPTFSISSNLSLSKHNYSMYNFAEVHFKLFESLWKLVQNSTLMNDEFLLNSLVLWAELLDNGLCISPQLYNSQHSTLLSTLRARWNGSYEEKKVEGLSLLLIGKVSGNVLSGSRNAICKVVESEKEILSLLQWCAIFRILNTMILESDHLNNIEIFIIASWILQFSPKESAEDILKLKFLYDLLRRCSMVIGIYTGLEMSSLNHHFKEKLDQIYEIFSATSDLQPRDLFEYGLDESSFKEDLCKSLSVIDPISLLREDLGAFVDNVSHPSQDIINDLSQFNPLLDQLPSACATPVITGGRSRSNTIVSGNSSMIFNHFGHQSQSGDAVPITVSASGDGDQKSEISSRFNAASAKAKTRFSAFLKASKQKFYGNSSRTKTNSPPSMLPILTEEGHREEGKVEIGTPIFIQEQLTTNPISNNASAAIEEETNFSLLSKKANDKRKRKTTKSSFI